MQELQNITLVWNYILGGYLSLARFSNVTGGGSPVIIAQKFGSGSTNVAPAFQGRFISNTKAWLEILTVQRTDELIYGFLIIDYNFHSYQQYVGLFVNCK